MNEFQNISSNLRRAPAAGADKSSSAEAAAQLNNIKSNLRQSKALEETPRKSSAPVDEEELPEFRRVKLRQTRVIEESKPGNNGPVSVMHHHPKTLLFLTSSWSFAEGKRCPHFASPSGHQQWWWRRRRRLLWRRQAGSPPFDEA